MEPEIRYVRTADGVTIAYHEMGEGAPFVFMDLPYSHLQTEWRLDSVGDRIYSTVASAARLIRYDHRGFGLSEREIADWSLDAFVLDLEAVVDRLELPSFALYAGRGPTTPIAVTYAARHPERVQRLILYHAAARTPPLMREQVGALLAMPNVDWRFASESLSRLVQGWEDDRASQELAGLLRDSVDLEGFRRWFEAYASWDIVELLPRVRMPALLASMLRHPWFGPEHARVMAAAMPDARTVVIDGETGTERLEQLMAAARAFVGAPAPAPRPPDGRGMPSGTAIIMFADIVDSTGMTERMGDAAFRDRARALDERLRGVIREHGGTPVEGKLLGDGVLATFGAASQAIAAAMACGAAGSQMGLELHLGLHAGDVIREADNVFGGAVNIASRISALSAQGEVLVSRTVADLARTSAGVTFEDRGDFELKGIAEPQRVFAVRPSSG